MYKLNLVTIYIYIYKRISKTWKIYIDKFTLQILEDIVDRLLRTLTKLSKVVFFSLFKLIGGLDTNNTNKEVDEKEAMEEVTIFFYFLLFFILSFFY